MFSQVCIKNYVHRGKGRCSPSKTDTSPGQTAPPPPTAIAADGTHSTGMYSCLNILILGWSGPIRPQGRVPLIGKRSRYTVDIRVQNMINYDVIVPCVPLEPIMSWRHYRHDQSVPFASATSRKKKWQQIVTTTCHYKMSLQIVATKVR